MRANKEQEDRTQEHYMVVDMHNERIYEKNKDTREESFLLFTSLWIYRTIAANALL